MNKTEKILKAQSQACADYMRFLDNQILLARKKSTVQVVQKVVGTNSFLTYTRNK